MPESEAAISMPHVPTMQSVLRTIVLSPHRLVPLTLAAAGRASASYSVAGSAASFDEALRLMAQERPDVLIFDPTALSLRRMPSWLEEAMDYLPHPQSIVLLLEVAQQATPMAARFAWAAGARCAVTSQDAPEFWAAAIESASKGATYASPIAAHTFGLSPWNPYRSVLPGSIFGGSPVNAVVKQEPLLTCA
jgi:DNA-binding NarL/FixJ family response regulator